MVTEGTVVAVYNPDGGGGPQVGMRLLEVNGASLLGATHAEAVNALRAATHAPLHLVVCRGYSRADKYTVSCLCLARY